MKKKKLSKDVKTETVLVYMAPKLKRKVRKSAAKEGVSMTVLIEQIVEKGLR